MYMRPNFFPVVVFLITFAQIGAFYDGVDRSLLLPSPSAAWTGQVLTSLFAHANVSHLSGNAIAQLLVGSLIEIFHGHERFLQLYVWSGVGGVLTFRQWWLWEGHGVDVRYVGCSPAVYGLLASAGSHVVLNWSEIYFRWIWLAFLIVSFGLEILVYVARPVNSSVAYSSHLGGGVCGLLLGLALLRNVRRHRWETTIQIVAGVSVLGVFGGLWMIE